MIESSKPRPGWNAPREESPAVHSIVIKDPDDLQRAADRLREVLERNLEEFLEHGHAKLNNGSKESGIILYAEVPKPQVFENTYKGMLAVLQGVESDLTPDEGRILTQLIRSRHVDGVPDVSHTHLRELLGPKPKVEIPRMLKNIRDRLEQAGCRLDGDIETGPFRLGIGPVDRVENIQA